MMLCKRHRTGVKPAVDNFGYTVHFAAAFRTLHGNGIDVRSVKLYLGILGIAAPFRQLCAAADAFLMTAAAFPDVKRSAPVTVTGDCPVLYIGKPVAETSLADGFGNPIDGVVVAD